MKKFLSIILCVFISAGAACMAASCGAHSFGADRSTVSLKSIYIKQSDSGSPEAFLINTSNGDWLIYNADDGSYSFSDGAPSLDEYVEHSAYYDYSGKIAGESVLNWGYYKYGPEFQFIFTYFIDNFVEEDLGIEVVAANLVVIDQLFFLNIYSSYNGDLLYKENVVASYLGFANNNGEEIEMYEKYTDGRVYLFYNGLSSVYERDNVVYAYSDGVETELFEDDMYDRPLQHDNTVKLYYAGDYMYFERVRDCIGYSIVTYTVSAVDGSYTADICTVKRGA